MVAPDPATPDPAALEPVSPEAEVLAADPSVRTFRIATIAMVAALAVAPWAGIYPVFLMKALCFALFACAFNLLIGYVGLLSFGHAMFFGTAGYVSAHAAKVWGLPPEFSGAFDLGFMMLPRYRAWVVVASLFVCLATWYVVERTKLGAYLRAATENPTVVQAFGVNVPRMITLTYGFGVGLAALAGVMAAPIYQVSPQMGANLIIVVFAVVVIGGMGSIMGSIVTGFALGLIEGLTKVFYPQASNTVIFVIMVIGLMLRPAGLFGRER